MREALQGREGTAFQMARLSSNQLTGRTSALNTQGIASVLRQ